MSHTAESVAPHEVHRLVDHLFRHQAVQMVATLTRIFGHENLDLAEEVVQDALLKALQQWPFHGIPHNPRAWLIQAAKHRAVDVLRRRSLHDRKQGEIAREFDPDGGMRQRVDQYFAGEVGDDQLRMMFLCCHPALPRSARVALTLSVVAGFGVNEIARAYLDKPATVAQRLARAKRRLREAEIEFEVPAGPELMERLDPVLEVVYLIFNEGYGAHAGESLVRIDLCGEAIRLGSLLAAHVEAGVPKTHALLALMLLQGARLTARTDAAGDLLLLADQDRATWDRRMIGLGMHHLERSASGDELSEYHIQAAIAAHHAAAPDFASTDWHGILDLYDQLMALNPSPVVALNRAVAVAMVHGPAAGLAAVRAIEHERTLRRYPLLPATLAELYRRTGETDVAAGHLRRALELPCSEAERRFLRQKLEGVSALPD